MSARFEYVYTMTDYYDAPRKGIANVNGVPHVYESIFDYDIDEYSVFYYLKPISKEILNLALEEWEMFQKWQIARLQDETTIEDHPVLPEDRKQFDTLRPVLEIELTIRNQDIEEHKVKYALAEFSIGDTLGLHGPKLPILVRWTLLPTLKKIQMQDFANSSKIIQEETLEEDGCVIELHTKRAFNIQKWERLIQAIDNYATFITHNHTISRKLAGCISAVQQVFTDYLATQDPKIDNTAKQRKLEALYTDLEQAVNRIYWD